MVPVFVGIVMGRSKWIICLCFLLGLWGCSDLKDGGVVGPPSQGTSLSFAGDIRPILQQNCASCHSGNEAPGGYDLTSFSGLLGPGSDGVSNAIPGNAQSLLVAITQSGDHAGFAGNQAGVLRKWVVEDSLGLRQPHVHPIGFMDPGSASFHGSEIASSSWDMSACRSCHGQDYEGGVALKTCVSCHINTPEDCSTCHGTGVSPAPPRDLSGSFSTQSGGVGAHQTHLLDGDLTEAIACEVCHQVPAALSDAGHVDSDLPAEITFGALAKTGERTPVWNGEGCANTYCHRSAEPRWTSVGVGEAACGTCHGTPPPAETGHPPVAQCSLCHPRVADDNLNIVNKALHINGQIEIGQ